MMNNYPQTVDPNIPRIVVGSFNLAQAAATYDILTANGGDVYVEILQAYVKTAAGGLTSISMATNHTTPKSVVASINLASITLDLIMTLVVPNFILPSTKKIQGTIVGTGNAGLIYVVCRWQPAQATAVLS